jgi:hypothetical protein
MIRRAPRCRCRGPHAMVCHRRSSRRRSSSPAATRQAHRISLVKPAGRHCRGPHPAHERQDGAGHAAQSTAPGQPVLRRGRRDRHAQASNASRERPCDQSRRELERARDLRGPARGRRLVAKHVIWLPKVHRGVTRPTFSFKPGSADYTLRAKIGLLSPGQGGRIRRSTGRVIAERQKPPVDETLGVRMF